MKRTDSEIIVNAIKCRHCRQIIRSFEPTEAVTCHCGKCTVYGGREHLVRSGIPNVDYIELSAFDLTEVESKDE